MTAATEQQSPEQLEFVPLLREDVQVSYLICILYLYEKHKRIFRQHWTTVQKNAVLFFCKSVGSFETQSNKL
jgi:hypothetical protein